MAYIIANRYYFLSTYIKTALSEGRFESLYYHKEYQGKGFKLVNGTLEIKLKSTVSKEHAPLISRIISNKTSEINFKYFYRQTSKHLRENPQDTYKSIVMGFPFEKNEVIDIHSNYINLGEIFYKNASKTKFDERNVVLLTHIYKDKVPYNYTHLKYKYKKRETHDTLISINEDVEPNIPKENPKQSGAHTKIKPSNRYLSRTEVHKVENQYDFSDINVSAVEITEKLEREIYNYNSDEIVDDSSEKPESSDSKNKTQKLLIKDSLKLNCFQLDDFHKLLYTFFEKYNIQDYYISDPINLENPEDSKINKFFIDQDKKEPRQILYGHFIYNELLINFIEAEHNLYWEKNTWFFISNQIFYETQIQNIINTNILKNQSHKKMLESSKIYGALKLFSTQHEHINIDNDDSIDNWCTNLRLGINRYDKLKK